MRPLRSASLLLGCFFVLLAFSPLPLSAVFKAALSVRVITPEPLLPISGGIGPSVPTKEKKSDLTVRAFVFEQGTHRVAIVQTDFLGFPSALGNRARAHIKSVPGTHVVIGATHTHSAPDAYGFPGSKPDLKFLEGVCLKIAEAVDEAASQLQPARLKIATAEIAEGIAYNYYAPELYDRRCSVIQALDLTGKPIGTLVNYAIHPEVLSAGGGILSPDLIGPLCEFIEKTVGGRAMFMNGAQGGMITADNRARDAKGALIAGAGDIRTWDEAVRIGELLGKESLRLVAKAPAKEDASLRCLSKSVVFPVDSLLLRTVMASSPLNLVQANGGDLTRVTTQMNLIELGDAQIITIPGEALPNIGFYLKRKMTGKQNLLFGLANDSFGYILMPTDFKSFKRYDYVSSTSLGERTGEILVSEVLKLVESAGGRQRDGE